MSVFDRFKFWKREYEKADQAKGASVAATIQLDDQTRRKIERRARRAFEDFDAGLTSRRHHRVSKLGKSSLLYRLRHKPGEKYYGGEKIFVSRADDGEVKVPGERPPLPPVDLDLRSKGDLDKISTAKRVRAYKVTTKDGNGPHYPSLQYEVGKEMEVTDFDTNPAVDCGKGINLASLDWCKSELKDGYRLFAVDFDPADLAAIPTKGAGKFRVKRCVVVEELDPSAAK